MLPSKVILGVSGSISAYKSVLITRLLVSQGVEVQIVLTKAAAGFITPLTLSTLSKKPVLSELFNPESGEWNNHVELAEWADSLVIAPCTANSIAKMAYGICDNLLLSIYLSFTKPVFVAPAMDHDMYHHQAVQQNLEVLKNRGHHIIPPEHGELASGVIGTGRLPEPESIVAQIARGFEPAS